MEVESMQEMFVSVYDFVEELEESQISDASIVLFLGELKKIGHSSKDVLAAVVILRELIQDSSRS